MLLSRDFVTGKLALASVGNDNYPIVALCSLSYYKKSPRLLFRNNFLRLYSTRHCLCFALAIKPNTSVHVMQMVLLIFYMDF